MWGKWARKAKLLANLTILVWLSTINVIISRARSLALSLLNRVAPNSRAEAGLLVSTYEVMRERLRESLKEIERKNEQLKKSGEHLKHSRDFLQAIIFNWSVNWAKLRLFSPIVLDKLPY